MPRATITRSARTLWAHAAAALFIAAAGAGLPALADPASTMFRITITLVPQGEGACSASAETGAPQVTCRPSVVGVPSVGTGRARDRSPVVGRLPDAPLKLAGEFIEVGVENHYAWTESNYLAWGEYSSRLVAAGGFEYVEMTFSW